MTALTPGDAGSCAPAHEQRSRPVALLAALGPEPVEHGHARARTRSPRPTRSARAGGRGRARAPRPRPPRSRRPRRPRTRASFTSWQTIRPSTRPGASSTHSAWKPSRAKKPSAASAANAWVPGPRVSSTSAASSGGSSAKPTAPGSPRAAQAAGGAQGQQRRAAGHVLGGRRPGVDDQLGRAALAQLVAGRPRALAQAVGHRAVADDRHERPVAAARRGRLGIVGPVRRRPRRTRSSRARSCGRGGRPPPSAPGSGSAASAARRSDSSANDLATSKPTSMPTRSISSNGPIRKPPPMRQMRSICSCGRHALAEQPQRPRRRTAARSG